jgi:hypothetical protein
VDANTAPDKGHASQIAVGAIVLGAGATAGMDLWALALRRCCGAPSLHYALLGRWIGHFRGGRFRHENIAQAAPIRHERVIGWTAHYAIGVGFASMLLAIVGRDWLKRPTVAPALLVSTATLVAPFLVMQPAMGAGIAGSRTPRPRLRSVAAHSVYGAGLYLSARLWTFVRRS